MSSVGKAMEGGPELGGGGGGLAVLNVSQAEDALSLMAKDSPPCHGSSLNSSINGESTDPPGSNPTAQTPDSAFGGTPLSTPDQDIQGKVLGEVEAAVKERKEEEAEDSEDPCQKSTESVLTAEERSSEEGYEEDDEGGEEGEEEEVVVSAAMQFPLTQQKPGPRETATPTPELGGEGGAGELAGQEGVQVKVNRMVTLTSQKEASPSGCESDVEDNAEEDEVSPARPRIPADLQLPSTVTRLDTPQGSSVFLVGTAHFSRESQEDVATTIRTVKPDVVVVELCKARTAILQLDEETILQESRSLDFKKMQMIMRQHGKIQGVLYLLLLSVSAHITKQLGMAPGGEFRTAFSEARKSAPGCMIQLGDRPIQITLSRALASLSLWHKVKLTWHILTSKEPISKEEVEKCKQRDFILEMLAEMTGQFPAISEVFVRERDLYLCRSLQAAAQPLPHPLSPTGKAPRVVVGVVGIGHVPGIVEHWGKVTDADIAPIMRVPPPTLSSRLLKVGFRVAVYGALGFGVYKCLPHSAKSAVHASLHSAAASASGLLVHPWRK